MRPYLFGLLVFLCTAIAAQGQRVDGFVLGAEAAPLPGAKVYWLETGQGTLTDSAGAFSLARPDTGHYHLVAVLVGYDTDTFCNEGETPIRIDLQPMSLGTVNIRDRQKSSFIGMDPMKTEVLTRTALEKDACCDLAGCFNTQAGVEARTTNILTNAKELQVLGLAGVYNQLLLDGMPVMRGAAYTYGISGIPGTAIDKIYVSKGAGSVLQGADGITGQINVVTIPPAKADPLFFNFYLNSFLEQHYNANFSARLGNNWSTILTTHSAQPGMGMDRDNDTFRDMPWLRRYHVSNRWDYRDPDSLGLSLSLSGRFLEEHRVGGQWMDHGHDGMDSLYKQSVDIRQPEAMVKGYYRYNENNITSLYVAGQMHTQNAWYGPTSYQADQSALWATGDHAIVWRERQQLKMGASLRLLDLREDIAFSPASPPKTYAGRYQMTEQIVGGFLEQTSYLWEEKITVIAGARADHHNQFGWFFTPRALVRFNPGRGFTARVSAGTGFRTVALFSENLQMLASGRDVIFEEAIQPERAVNYGLNVDKQFFLRDVEGRIGLDLYATRFQNQFFPDYDRDPGYAYIHNFDGRSEGYGLQVETAWEFVEHVEARVAYNYLEVFRVENGTRIDLPFIAKHKIMGALSYFTEGRRFHVDGNLHWYGLQRLPNTENHPAGFNLPSVSEPYFVLNGQAAYKLDKQGVWDVYAGCENILGFRQVRPIAGWQTPFSTYFDTAFVWGPTRGREFYIGVRIKPML